ncbi:Hsp70 family protein [bacterium]|nr:Hsp70 family protein [bacterium]
MYLGLDFGTSFSQPATIFLDNPKLLLEHAEYGIPSAFYYDREYEILVGQEALDAGQGNQAKNLVREVKMDIIDGKQFYLDGRNFSTKDIVKEIYKSLISKAIQVAKKEANINTNIEGVVISVPAKFGMQECYLLKEAVENCWDTKIPVMAIIKEPVAAALAYYNTGLEDDKHILVYDLGGGTCDVALVRSDSSAAEHYTVIDSDMVRIGGRLWDEKLASYITQDIEKKAGINFRDLDEETRCGYEEKIRREAIKAKHALSDPDKEKTMIRVELNGRIYTTSVTKSLFDELTISLLLQTFECLENVYSRNSNVSIDEIICVGGSSNMRQVRERLSEHFPGCEIKIFEPELAVVNGAAIYANMPRQSALIDRVSFSYGTDSFIKYTDNQIVSNIIKQGDEFPITREKHYSPRHDNQETVCFNIYESEIVEEEYPFSEPNKRFIGNVTLKLPPHSPNTLDLTCQLKLSNNGILEVEATEPSGHRIEATFDIKSL